jgi:hypothetical protein
LDPESREAAVTIDDVRRSLRAKLEQQYTPEEASYLMDRPPGGWNDLVTNESLRLSTDTLRAEMGELRAELRTEMGELRTELKGEMAELRIEMAGLSASVDRRLRAQTWVHTSTLIAGLALAAAIGRLG